MISIWYVKVHWVVTYTKLYQKDEKRRLDTAKEELASMKYHPVQEHKPTSGGENEHVKRKKLKICNSCESLTRIPPNMYIKSKLLLALEWFKHVYKIKICNQFACKTSIKFKTFLDYAVQEKWNKTTYMDMHLAIIL